MKEKSVRYSCRFTDVVLPAAPVPVTVKASESEASAARLLRVNTLLPEGAITAGLNWQLATPVAWQARVMFDVKQLGFWSEIEKVVELVPRVTVDVRAGARSAHGARAVPSSVITCGLPLKQPNDPIDAVQFESDETISIDVTAMWKSIWFVVR